MPRFYSNLHGPEIGQFYMRCWGDFGLTAPDGRDITPRGRKARALLAWLALHAGKPVSRERLAGLLWGDRADRQARASLRQTMYEIRDLSSGLEPLLQVDAAAIMLAGHRLARDTDHPDRLLFEPGDRLFRDLDDIDEGFDEWLQFERSRQDDRNKAACTIGDEHGDLRLLVLDFENRSDDPSLDVACCDLADDLRHILAGFRALSVYGRATSRRSASGAAGLSQATHVLDATLRALPLPAEIRLQLHDTRTGRLLWVDRQSCEPGGPLSLRPSTAADVASALGIRGTPPLLAESINPAALDLYLEARRIAGPGESRTRCIAHYEAALRIAPDLAAAWAGLAQALAYGCRYDTRKEPFETLASRARNAAMRALRLDPQAALAWTALGALEPYAAYGRREAQLDRAISAAPNDPELLRQRGEAAHTVGRFEEAQRYLQRAFEIDSSNVLVRQNHAMNLGEVGPLVDCVDAYVAGRRQIPDFAWFFIADPWLIAANSGDWAMVDRISPIATAANLPELDSVKWTINALRNPSSETRSIVMSAAERGLAKRGFVNTSTLVLAANLGMVGQAFAWVKRSDYSHLFRADGGVTDTKGHYQGVLLGVTNRAMQANPGFVELCSKIGLTRYWTETGRWPDCAEALQAKYGFVDLAKRMPGPEIAAADDF